MDSNTRKILKYLIKNDDKHFSIIELSDKFSNISKDHIVEIVNILYQDKYVKYVGDASIKITNKGKTYFITENDKWISKNIVSLLALAVSIIALIRTL